MTLTATQRQERARKGGNATKARYGGASKRGIAAYYRSLAAKSPKAGAPRIPSLAEDMATPEGRRAMAELAASYGVDRGAIPAVPGRAGHSIPAASSPTAGRLASGTVPRAGTRLVGDQTLGSSCPTSITPQPGSCPRQVTGAGHNSSVAGRRANGSGEAFDGDQLHGNHPPYSDVPPADGVPRLAPSAHKQKAGGSARP